MRRGLQITSIVILSPVLLVLISLMTVLGYSLYSYITSSYMISTVTTTAMMTTSLSKRTFSTRQRMVKRLFSKTKLPIAWFILCLLCYIIHKKRKYGIQNPQVQDLPPVKVKTQHKKHKRRKITNKKCKKRSRSISISSTETQPVPPEQHVNNNNNPNINKEAVEEQQDDKEWTSVDNHKRKVNKIVHSKPSTTPIHTYDLNLLTPAQSEDEEEEQIPTNTTKNWYSPFSTGLDLDIIPKIVQPQELIVKTHLFHSQIPSTSLQLLENHPFIPTSHTTHHNIFGFIGDQRKTSRR